MAAGQRHDANLGGRQYHGRVLPCLVGTFGLGKTSPGYATLHFILIHEIRHYLWRDFQRLLETDEQITTCRQSRKQKVGSDPGDPERKLVAANHAT